MLDVRVISIGALDAHPEWGEGNPVRTAHATTTLVRSGDRIILVDPALPPQILAARLGERAGLEAGAVTDVFLTCFRPDVRRGLEAFDGANWLVSEAERESVGVSMVQAYQRAEEAADTELADQLKRDIGLLHRCTAAPDRLADHIDLFPLPGVTPGLCGLLIAERRRTVLVTGDAVATLEHLEAGRVVRWAADVERARESFAEAVEIADVLVPGRDNVLINPTRGAF
ncbi:MAG: MBL fold metallo-hydrolase [Planctomycetota bacterium]